MKHKKSGFLFSYTIHKFFLFLIITFFACTTVSAQVTASELFGKKSLTAPRVRIIIDNDFSGDPDGLFQLAHHLLSPSVEIRAIIGSHLTSQTNFGGYFPMSADSAATKAREVVRILGLEGKVPVLAGANSALTDSLQPKQSEGASFIVKEAMREDTKLPLYVVCGAGLTNIASAYLMEPRIANRITLVWIGGKEYDSSFHPQLSPILTKRSNAVEYNISISIPAAKVIFNNSSMPVWQVPRDAYRQCLYSFAEIMSDIKPQGKIGSYLADNLFGFLSDLAAKHWNMGETYILGDSPLVLLTALQSGFESDACSSHYLNISRPRIKSNGDYEHTARKSFIRVYDHIDCRLMYADMIAKLKLSNNKAKTIQ
ncbi:nucleoside hydrolase [uncultured Bacteroides sp.]|uniref:nucleoside hydrolase n=1 Tax=uncultured Bacteroides sp. TaxID=162156 RepID=UPI002AAC2D9F|nr:nucleoside hydrolase [uncultured Bacteroides sp.]